MHLHALVLLTLALPATTANPSLAAAGSIDTARDDDIQTLPARWTCIARTSVLQRAYSGQGPTEIDARATALDTCQDHAVFGCYVARCDRSFETR